MLVFSLASGGGGSPPALPLGYATVQGPSNEQSWSVLSAALLQGVSLAFLGRRDQSENRGARRDPKYKVFKK